MLFIFAAASPDKLIDVPSRPSWMPEVEWRSLVSTANKASCLKPIVASIPSESDAWRGWFTNATPESLRLPSDRNEPSSKDASRDQGLSGTDGDESNSASKEQHVEIQRLLTVKCLRPDRLHAAMKKACPSDMSNLPWDESFSSDDGCKPTIILLPCSTAADDDSSQFNGESISSMITKVLRSKAEVFIRLFQQ